jgi:hypothetical protein
MGKKGFIIGLIIDWTEPAIIAIWKVFIPISIDKIVAGAWSCFDFGIKKLLTFTQQVVVTTYLLSSVFRALSVDVGIKQTHYVKHIHTNHKMLTPSIADELDKRVF